MWPAVLAARLQANKATANVAVVNAGIGGNRILGDGNGGLARLYHDAISQPGVKWIMLLEGINDITAGARRAPPLITADDLIAAYRQVIETAHLYGIKVIGCTITPDGGSSAFSDYGETVREAANRWIVTSGRVRCGGGFRCGDQGCRRSEAVPRRGGFSGHASPVERGLQDDGRGRPAVALQIKGDGSLFFTPVVSRMSAKILCPPFPKKTREARRPPAFVWSNPNRFRTRTESDPAPSASPARWSRRRTRHPAV